MRQDSHSYPATARILIYRIGSLGDFIVSLPCLNLIARTFPNAHRTLLTNFPVNEKAPSAAAVIGDSGLVHSYLRYTAGTRNPIDLARVWGEIRRYRPQVLVYLMPTLTRAEQDLQRNLLFFRSAGIRNIIAPDQQGLTNPFDPSTKLYQHESHRLAHIVAPLGDAAVNDPSSWDLHLTRGEHSAARARLAPLDESPLIAVSLGTKAQANHWTLPNWTALLKRLTAQRPDWNLVLLGAPSEREECQQLASIWKAKSLNLCGELSLRETACALSQAEVFVGHDSGPLHLASSVQVPSVGIYSARNLPGIWFPYGQNNRVIYHRVDCMGCGLVTCIEQKKKCILSITVDEVLGAIYDLTAPRSRSAANRLV